MTKTCSKCGIEKDIEFFHKDKRYLDGLFCWCKDCRKKYQQNMKENWSEGEWEQRRKYNRGNYAKYAQNYTKSRRRRNRSLKEEVMSHYCIGSPKCMKCGYGDIRALAIDHVNDDGAEHRRELFNGTKAQRVSTSIYYWLRMNDYPDGFQVLCFNCNQIKEYERRQRNIKYG